MQIDIMSCHPIASITAVRRSYDDRKKIIRKFFSFTFYSDESNCIGQFSKKKKKNEEKLFYSNLVLHNRSTNTLRLRAHAHTIHTLAVSRVVDILAVHVIYILYDTYDCVFLLSLARF